MNSVTIERRIASCAIVIFTVLVTRAQAAELRGRVVSQSDSGAIPHCYVAVADAAFSIKGQGASRNDGSFTVPLETPVKSGFLIVQPNPVVARSGLGAYPFTPRIYAYSGEPNIDLKLPAASCIVLMAYDTQGQLMRWEDFRKRGTIGDQFMYATDTNDCAVEATCWPVYDEEARKLGQPREKGLPALMVAPGKGYVPQVLFWETRGYGKLQLRADNGGEGFVASKEPLALELNVELARTAVAAISKRFREHAKQFADAFNAVMQKTTPAERAKAADELLVDALKTRDELELARAREAIAKQGQRGDFSFGVFEGSPYNQKAFKIAYDAGFDLATVLLGWGWTDARGGAVDKTAIEQTFGIEKLRKQGFGVKAHGVVWLQDYGILPDRARGMAPDKLRDSMLAQEKALLDAYGNSFAVWEAMNEPNVTNVVNLPRNDVSALFGKSTEQASSQEKLTVLVNGAHEGDYGRRFTVYKLDNTPVNDWNRTYLSYLQGDDVKAAVSQLDTVGLQFYPGFHFNESFGGLQGPAVTPSSLIDTIDRYAALGKPIHITETSMPSTYGSDWVSGYWREPWTQQTQADYAEMIFTFAYADPRVQSISWWDVMDTKSSVTTGGLCDANGKPKLVLERLQKLIAGWKTP
ncbi:MAG: endo-1,4-beta-xylanase [Candidatus Hydrogenedentes bacterium]|nr:endo-1,4-beta-xylanase [Candidatus Hydrogenedentota bacterium]